MKSLGLFLLFHSLAFATAYTASQNGNWDDATTWGNAGVPGNGDTCTVEGHIVTVRGAQIIGNSPAAGNVVLHFGQTGLLAFVAGGYLKVRGDAQYTGGDGITGTYLSMLGGSIFEFDSSLASSPSSTHYSVSTSASPALRAMVTAGTAGNRVIIRSNAGGGNGFFGSFNVGWSYSFLYTDFVRIGDSSNDALFQWTNADQGYWFAMYSTFTNCGVIHNRGAVGSVGTFKHDYNIHRGSLGATIFDNRANGAGAKTGGARELIGNDFDIYLDTFFDVQDYIVSSNYFGQSPYFGWTNGQKWALFENNLYRQDSPGDLTKLAGDTANNLWYVDAHTVVNPHGPALTTYGQTINGNITDYSGQLSGFMSVFYALNSGAQAGQSYKWSNNIILPNAKGISSTWLSDTYGVTGTSYDYEHNTVVVTNEPAIIATHPTNPQDPVGSVKIKNNIFWAPAGAVQSYVGEDLSGADPANACQPADCDYNLKFHLLTNGGGFSGGAVGYAMPFSGAAPGAHDKTVDPLFLDTTRNIATFDTQYLGNTAPAWNSGTTYNVGDIVSSSDASLYSNTALGFPPGGAVINYRYTNATYNWDGTACSGQNPKPGLLDSTSRACWEWASLYRIRQGVDAQTLYEDLSIGVAGNDIITTVKLWIAAGYSPANSAVSMAGSDGLDLGAVPVTLSAPTFPPVSLGTFLRNLFTRGVFGR